MSQSFPGYFPPALQQQAKVVTLAAGDALFELNDAVHHLFYVQVGEIKALRYLPDGGEITMLRAKGGELLGESTLAVERYICRAVAIRASQVASVPITLVKQALATNPEFSFQFTLAIARATRLQCSRYERLRLKHAADRVLHYLLCESNAGGEIDHPVHLYEWAHELGLQKETLYRTLATLERDGKICRTEQKITLLH